MKTISILTMMGVAFVAACGDGEDEVPGTEAVQVELQFEARFGAQAIGCQSQLPIGRLRDFRLYLSNLRLVDGSGAEAPIELDQNEWQNGEVALLDFEDGTESCSETGDARLRTVIEGVSAVQEASKLRFTLGVPFDRNHVAVDPQPAPLNLPAMFWNWRGGYKFLRLDIASTADAPDNKFNYHLGSNCEGPTAVEAPTACGKPNRADIELDFSLGQTVLLDVAALLEGVETSTTAGDTPPLGCMSSPGEPEDCRPVFSHLGLSVDTGLCQNGCSDQTFFSVAP